MDELIARIERATEGSRELDAEIMFDLYAKPVGKHKEDGGPLGYLWPEDNPSWSFGMRFPGKDRAWFKKVRKGHDETLLIERDGALVLMNSLRVPCLTTSVDAALSLVPEGWRLSLFDTGGGWKARLKQIGGPDLIAPFEHADKQDTPAPTLALALCNVALRARSTQERG